MTKQQRDAIRNVIEVLVDHVIAQQDVTTLAAMVAYNHAVNTNTFPEIAVRNFQAAVGNLPGWGQYLRFWDMATVAYIEREIARGVADRVARS